MYLHDSCWDQSGLRKVPSFIFISCPGTIVSTSGASGLCLSAFVKVADLPPGEVCSPLPQPPAILPYSLHLLNRLHGGGGENLAHNHLYQLESGNHSPLSSFTSYSAHPPVLQLGKRFSTVPLPRPLSITPSLSLPSSLLCYLLSFQISVTLIFYSIFASLNFSFLCSTSPYWLFLSSLLPFTQTFLPLMFHLLMRVCTSPDRQCLGWILFLLNEIRNVTPDKCFPPQWPLCVGAQLGQRMEQTAQQTHWLILSTDICNGIPGRIFPNVSDLETERDLTF